MELQRYGDLLSPRLKPVCLPNDWSGSQRTAAQSAMKGAKAVYAEFWPQFGRFMRERNSPIKSYHRFSPSYIRQAWVNYSTNRVFLPSVDLSIKYGVIIVSLYVDGSSKDIPVDGHKIVDTIMEKHGDEIVKELGGLADDGVEKLHAGKIHKSGRIQLALRDVDIEDREKWPDFFEWIAKCAEAIDKTLVPLVSNLSLDAYLMEQEDT